MVDDGVFVTKKKKGLNSRERDDEIPWSVA
jgi:hypothetical protein